MMNGDSLKQEISSELDTVQVIQNFHSYFSFSFAFNE